jgi:anti-sigma-K factor RskA
VNDHDRYDGLAGPYLLSALDEHERSLFEGHMAVCALCRDEVDELRVATEALPASVVQFDAPPELRDRIMSIVNREAQLLAAAGPEADRPATAAPASRERRGWRRRLGLLAPVLAAAAAAAFAVVVFDGSDIRTVEAAQAPQGAAVRMHIDEEHSTLVAEDLPAPPEGRVYQVWLKRPGRDPEPTRALFSPSAEGTVSVDVPGSVEGLESVLVTDEPIGGSDAPTRDPIIAVTPS